MTESNHSFFSGRRQLFATLLFLALVTLAVYSVSFFNGFVVDDEVIIVNNPQTLSLKNIPQVLLAPDLIKPYYRPLNRSTYLLDYRVAGMNPAWYHGVNIIIHLGNVLLLYLVASRLLPGRWGGLAAALLFAVHPVNSEAVNFISARNTLLALFFSLASLLVWMNSREKRMAIPIGSALLFFCGLLCKETALMMIAVFFLAAFFPLQQGEERLGWKGRLLYLSPFVLMTVVYFVMRACSLQGIVGTPVPAEGLLSRMLSNYRIIPQYMELLLFPADLTLFHRISPGGIFSPPWYLPAIIGLMAILWFVVKSRNRVGLFGFAWLFINYVPISSIVPIPSDQITERYLYMPAVGFFLGAGALFSWLGSKEKHRPLIWAGAGVIAVLLTCVTVERNLEWKNNLTLFASGVRNDPFSTAAHYNLGTALLEKGDLEAARREWEKTLSLDPAYADALTQLGTMLAVHGDLAAAERLYLAALAAPLGAADPDKSMAHYNLGKLYEKRGMPAQALGHYRRFVETVPLT
ncbi:MAG TPA: tetratricopeptide repeat protein, partial [Geobacteraceae bacterium]